VTVNDSLDFVNCIKHKLIRKVLQDGCASGRKYSVKLILFFSSGFILFLSVDGNTDSFKNFICTTEIKNDWSNMLTPQVQNRAQICLCIFYVRTLSLTQTLWRKVIESYWTMNRRRCCSRYGFIWGILWRNGGKRRKLPLIRPVTVQKFDFGASRIRRVNATHRTGTFGEPKFAEQDMALPKTTR